MEKQNSVGTPMYKFIGNPEEYLTQLIPEKGTTYPADTVLDPAHGATLGEIIQAAQLDVATGSKFKDEATQFLNDWEDGNDI